MVQEGGQLTFPFPLSLAFPPSVPFRFVASHVPFRLGQRGLQLNAASWLQSACVRFCCMLYMLQCYLLPPARLTFVVACSQPASSEQWAAGSLQQSWSYHFLALFMFDFVNLFYLLHYLSRQLSILTRYSFPWHFPTAFANRPRPLSACLSVCPSLCPTVCLWPGHALFSI